MINKGFLETDNYIMDNVHKLKDIPCSIVQGRYDIECPPDTAFELHKVTQTGWDCAGTRLDVIEGLQSCGVPTEDIIVQYTSF